MKKAFMFVAALCALALVAQEKVIISLNNLITEAVDSELFTEMSFLNESTLRVSANGTERDYALTDVDCVTFEDADDVVTVEYDGSTVHVFNPMAFAGVEVSADGAHVTVNSTTSQEVKYRLTGSTTDGSFKIYGVVKYELTLDGVNITNPQGAAINSQCKKKMT
ncbi:MAG: carbohydrate-binding domain-containing protein, partial [Muribaculaceae bacterium]